MMRRKLITAILSVILTVFDVAIVIGCLIDIGIQVIRGYLKRK